MVNQRKLTEQECHLALARIQIGSRQINRLSVSFWDQLKCHVYDRDPPRRDLQDVRFAVFAERSIKYCDFYSSPEK